MGADKPEIALRLGDLETTVRFVATHFSDLKMILRESRKEEEPDQGQ